MRGILNIEGVAKRVKGVLTIDWLTSAMAMWSATVTPPEAIAAFSEVTVDRDGVEIFGGVILEPKIEYGVGGTTRPLKGYDYTIKLLDYLCPYQSLVDVTTANAVAAILTNWPYDISVEGTFGYLSDPITFDTSCEFLEFEFQDTCIEFLRTKEISAEPDTDVNVLPDPGFRSCFYYDGATTRIYLFYGTGGTLRYRWSADCGATWSAENDTTLAIVANNYSVAWYDSKVYVFLEDGAGNTDFYRGTINDGTGAVTLGLITGNIFANWMQSGPWFTPNGNIWVVENTGGNNDAWESVNDGAAWNNRFTGTEVLHYMLPKSDGEDMWLVEFDVGNTHLELWDWDKSITTEAYVNQIRNFGGDLLEHVAGAQPADYKIHLAYSTDANELYYRGSNVAGVWGVERLVSNAMAGRTAAFHICADRYLYAYVAIEHVFGFEVAKGSETTWAALAGGEAQQGFHVSAPATGLWDGKLNCFFSFTGFNDDLWFYQMNPVGIRLDGGATTGYFTTDTITASGAMVFWGWVTGEGTQLTDMIWSVLKAADDSILVSGQRLHFDMNVAGVPPTELDIKLRCAMTDTGIDPLLTELDYSEYVDEVTLDTDLTEDTYVGIDKLRALAGAEFWVTKDGATYTFHFSSRRGSDKSNIVILKNAHSSKRPGLRPNIKLISKTPDWESFANSVMIIGAGTPGVDRIEVDLQDWNSVATYGEKWYSEPNLDIVSEAMGRTRSAVVLSAKNVVVERIKSEIIDKYESGALEIGDSAWFCIDFGDVEEEEIDQALRVIGLTRMYSPDGGEKVELTVVNVIKATEYWEYLGTVSDLSRWAVT